MRQYSTSIRIDAPPEAIWPILTDAARLTPDFGILRIEGRIAQGGAIKLWSEVSPSRAFALDVEVVEPPSRMIWSSGMPLGLFRGRRVFATRGDGAGTVFDMTERYTGPLAPLMFRMIPDLGPSFEKFANALKKEAER